MMYNMSQWRQHPTKATLYGQLCILSLMVFPECMVVMCEGIVQQWLGKYQDTAVEYAQQGYDQIQEYVHSHFNDYVEANNLTQVSLVLYIIAWLHAVLSTDTRLCIFHT